MSKKVYTKEDIYEGMVLECVKSNDYYITVGKLYVIGNALCTLDDYGVVIEYDDTLDLLNSNIVKVVESEEEQKVLQLSKYTFGLKTGDVEEISLWQGDTVIDKYLNVNKKHITIPAYNTQQAIEYLTNELEYDINDIVSMEVK